MLQLRRHKADALFDLGRTLFDAAGAMCDLIRGLLGELACGSRRFDQEPYLALVCDPTGEPVSVALRTPPHALLLTEADQEAVGLVADDLGGVELPGVVAPAGTARRFESVWCQRTGAASRVGLAMVVHQLSKVIPPRPSPGAMRLAKREDWESLEAWFRCFLEETGVMHPVEVETEIGDWLERERAFVWVDGNPVSMVVQTGDTDTSARVGWVYTPPGLRGRGYASNAVAGISSRLLERGKSYLSLWTDKANPTSNHIYRAVGYRPVGEFLDIRF